MAVKSCDVEEYRADGFAGIVGDTAEDVDVPAAVGFVADFSDVPFGFGFGGGLGLWDFIGFRSGGRTGWRDCIG